MGGRRHSVMGPTAAGDENDRQRQESNYALHNFSSRRRKRAALLQKMSRF